MSLNIRVGQQVIYKLGDEQTLTRIKSVDVWTYEGETVYTLSFDNLKDLSQATFWEEPDGRLTDTMYGLGGGVNEILL